ncbi:MFS transporter small subunit [Nocardioides marinquilinus]
MRARIIASWTLVAVPLAYGVVETVVRASQLFTG